MTVPFQHLGFLLMSTAFLKQEKVMFGLWTHAKLQRTELDVAKYSFYTILFYNSIYEIKTLSLYAEHWFEMRRYFLAGGLLDFLGEIHTNFPIISAMKNQCLDPFNTAISRSRRC